MKGIKTLRSISHLRAVAERAPGESTIRLRVVGLMAMAILLVSVASASPIIGGFNITDTCVGAGCPGPSGVIVGATTIDWFPPVGSPNGSFQVGGTSGGFSATGPFGNFSGLTGFEIDLNAINEPIGVPFVAGGPIVSMAGEGNVLPSFITFTGSPQSQAVLDLSFIQPGVYSSAACTAPPAAGQNCTPPGSAFNLSNGAGATTSTASLTLNGYVRRTDTGELSAFTGTYTTQFPPCNGSNAPSCGPYQNWLPILTSTGTVNTVSNTYSASFSSTAIPEPSTAFFMLGGIALIFLGTRYRARTLRNHVS
jgi:PEP-CTERM motif-containing protein